jgi:adenylate cyclase
MSEIRKIAAILVADVVGQPACGHRRGSNPVAPQGAAQRSDRPRHRRASRAHRQAHRRRQPRRVPSVVDAVRCAVEVQSGMIERNAGVPPD